MRVLYVTHYGILEPLGQAQVIPYLRELSQRGHAIEILSFEKPSLFSDRARVVAQQRRLGEHGIEWKPRAYRPGRRPGGFALSLGAAACEIERRCRAGIDLVHCRAHVPYLMAWPGALRHSIPVLFDFRGFLADEYVDAGLWRAGGVKFRIAKMLEKRMAAGCAAIVVLTRAAGRYLADSCGLDRDKIFVIPCCVDFSRFGGARDEIPGGGPLQVVYSGSTTGRYRVGAMLKFFRLVLDARPGSRLTLLSSSGGQDLASLVRNSGLPPEAVYVTGVRPEQVPPILSRMDLGLIFLEGTVGLLGTSPTKLAEYLASGLVVVAERGLGDIDELLVRTGAGCLVDSGSPGQWPEVVAQALALCGRRGARLNAQSVAAGRFALETGVEDYARAWAYAARKAARTPERKGGYFRSDRAL